MLQSQMDKRVLAIPSSTQVSLDIKIDSDRIFLINIQEEEINLSAIFQEIEKKWEFFQFQEPYIQFSEIKILMKDQTSYSSRASEEQKQTVVTTNNIELIVFKVRPADILNLSHLLCCEVEQSKITQNEQSIEIKELALNLSNQNNRIEKQEHQIAQQAQSINKLTKEGVESKQTINQLTTKLQEETTNIKNQQSSIDKLTEEVAESKAIRNEQADSIAKLMHNVQQLVERDKQRGSYISEMQGELNSEKQQKNMLKISLDQAEQQHQQVEKQHLQEITNTSQQKTEQERKLQEIKRIVIY